jgi:hypothetical protein
MIATGTTAAVYAELHRNAARTGGMRGTTLAGGLRLTVRVREGLVTLTIARKSRHVGDAELIALKCDCGVPAEAERRPVEGQKSMERGDAVWWYLSYRWEEESHD